MFRRSRDKKKSAIIRRNAPLIPQPRLLGLLPSVSLVVVGENGVGKTCITYRYRQGAYKIHEPTIGGDLVRKRQKVNTEEVLLEIWDTGGHESFTAVAKRYVKLAQGIILVYDITDRSSFFALNKWFIIIKSLTSVEVPVIIVGNKCDLENERQVSHEEVKKMVLSHPQVLSVVESSAKEAINIEKTFMRMVRAVIKISQGSELTQSFIHMNGSLEEKPTKCPTCEVI